MFLLNLILFILIYIGEIYAIELVLPPFAKFYYTDMMDILISFATDLSLKFEVSFNLAFVLVGIGLAIIPLFIILMIKLKLRRRRKKATARYRFR